MINRELDYRNLTTLLNHVLTQWSMTYLHTAMPGIIDSFDATTRRARVRPALRLVMQGATPEEDGEEMERALSVNVPVMFSAGGGLTSYFPLVAGDRGMLFFSERGLTEFKQTGELATPDKARFFDESDSIFFPFDWGHPTNPTIADAGAACLQTYDGSTFLAVKDGSVTIESNTITLRGANRTVVIP